MKTSAASQSTDPTGFSLIELVVVILILTVLAGVIAPRVSVRQAAARDARRLADVRAIHDAIEQYYVEQGSYPVAERGLGQWSASHDGDFIPALVEAGYLSKNLSDPINDDRFHYRYRTYLAGQNGCIGTTPYYVLGIRNFEQALTATKNPGYFRCSGLDWSTKFAYVTGGGASYQ